MSNISLFFLMKPYTIKINVSKPATNLSPICFNLNMKSMRRIKVVEVYCEFSKSLLQLIDDHKISHYISGTQHSPFITKLTVLSGVAHRLLRSFSCFHSSCFVVRVLKLPLYAVSS